MGTQSTHRRTPPEAAFVEPLAGKWTNPRLGTIEIRRDKTGFMFDAGEWQSPIGEHKDPSGARRIILTGPPFAGFAFWPQQHEGKTMLLFETAQQKYWFERPPATAADEGCRGSSAPFTSAAAAWY